MSSTTAVNNDVDNVGTGIKFLFDSLNLFIKQCNGLADSFTPVQATVRFNSMFLQKRFHKVLTENGTTIQNDADGILYSIPQTKLRRTNLIYDQLQSSNLAERLLPRSIFIAMISQYDVFVGNMIRSVYRIKPEKLNETDKTIKASDLFQYESIDDAKNAVIEDHVENQIRASHIEQIEWFEKKLNVPLTKYDAWKTFVEVTQRRNIMVHCDGIVSKQYISVCKKHGAINIPKIGESLDIDSDYISNARLCLLETSIKLSQMILRKLDDKFVDYANDQINEVIVNLISNDDFDLALRLSEFAIARDTIHQNDTSKLYAILNHAQIYKWLGQNNEMNKVLSNHDWDSRNDVIRLAYSVLVDDYSTAITIMKKLGANSDEFKKEAYLDFPIFREFRKQECFAQTFQEIFGESPDIHEFKDDISGADIEEVFKSVIESISK